MAGFLADERLAALVEAGQLVLILWDGTSWCSGPQHIKCWQPVVYVRPAAQALPVLCAMATTSMAIQNRSGLLCSRRLVCSLTCCMLPDKSPSPVSLHVRWQVSLQHDAV